MEGIQRLANLLQQLAQNRTGNAAAVRASSIEQLGAFLQWLVAEAATLSPDARTEAFWWVLVLPVTASAAPCISSFVLVYLLLRMAQPASVDLCKLLMGTHSNAVLLIYHRLPIQLGSKVTSRISARAIRTLLEGQQTAAQRDSQAGRSQATGATAQGTPFVTTTERDVAAAAAASAAAAPVQASASQAGPLPSANVSTVSGSGVHGPVSQPGSSAVVVGASQQALVPLGRLDAQQPVQGPSPAATSGSQRVPVAPTATQQVAANADAGAAPAVAPTVDVKVDQSGARRSVSLNGSTTPGKAPVRMIELSAAKPRTGSLVIERESEKSEALL